jgi:hypothetical protein
LAIQQADSSPRDFINDTQNEGGPMVNNRWWAALMAAVVLAGCAGMVASNDGNRVTIEHDGFVSRDSAQEVATKSCIQAGKSRAVHVVTANKNPRFEPGFGVQLSTFQCEK